MSGLYHKVHEGPAAAPTLVLLHGWGLHSGVWEGFLPALTPHFRVVCVDLPGFGKSSVTVSGDRFFNELQALLPEPALWLGWSLGGLYALEMARRHPASVRALCLLAATPCFLQRPDWHAAMPPEVFADFSDALKENPLITLEGFLALQCKGSQSMKPDLRFLHTVLSAHALPASAVLQAGLQQLARSDLRQDLRTFSMPLLVLLGERDVLVPVAVGRAIQDIRPDAVVLTLPKAAHLPFVSHPQACADALLQFSRVSTPS